MGAEYEYLPVRGELWMSRGGVVYLNSNALDRYFKSKRKTREWMSLSVEERAEQSPYRAELMSIIETAKSRGFRVDEFVTPNC